MNKISLTEDQQTILDKLYTFITKGDNDMGLLEGAAGTGKTTLIKSLIEKVTDQALLSNICISSPTHKALAVIKEMFNEKDQKDLSFATLHSLLGLKHQITKDGTEIFIRDNKSISKLFMYDLIVVDEASMVADQLFNEILDQNYKNVKILFVGDSNQINPVNHVHAIPMLEEKRKEYKIDHYKLTKIIRQAEGNPIINTSQQILNNNFVFKNGEKILDEETNTGVVMVSNAQHAVMNKLLTYYFCSESFDKNANFCKVLAWRNVIVDEFNKTIRQLKYGLKTPKLVIGEKLIVDRPIKQEHGDEILFYTNEDLEILDLDVKEKILFGKAYTYYNTKVQGDLDINIIHILHEKSEKLYKITLDELSSDAKKETDNFKRVSAWRKYFSFMENFAMTKYNYAVTAHNSQGSTYDNCFVYYSDIMLNRNHNERKRILYTAVTRPKNILYIM